MGVGYPLDIVVCVALGVDMFDCARPSSRKPATYPPDFVFARSTVGFHNFNLPIFNLRVSNPNKLIVDVFLTRCRISMCQGLGPKNTKFRKSTAQGNGAPLVAEPGRRGAAFGR